MKVITAPAFYNTGSAYQTRVAQPLIITNTGSATPTVIQYRNLTAVGTADVGSNVIFLGDADAKTMGYQQVAWEGTASDNGCYMSLQTRRSDSAGIKEVIRLTASGNVFVNDTANAKMTTGLTINQGSADDESFALKSSDIAHGRTAVTETDTYLSIIKESGASGGVSLNAMGEDAAIGCVLRIGSVGGTATTTKTVGGATSLVEFNVSEHNGSNGGANITADGNVFGITARVGGSFVHRILVDEDGDLYSVTSAQTFDEYDDALMVRALDHAKGDVIRDRWDDYVTYNEQALIDAEVLGAPVAEGGMTNVTQLQRLHNGAIWQGYTRQMEMQERIDTLETKLLALEGAR
jgi:hypothetical protein